MECKTRTFKDWITGWAQQKESNVLSVLCFGSQARGDATPSSDVDICIIGKSPSLNLFHEIISDLRKEFFGTLITSRVERNKFMALIFNISGRGKSPFRLDCYVVECIKEIETYIKGLGEGKLNIDKTIWYHNETLATSKENLDLITTLLYSEPISNDINRAISENASRFVESFEVASNKRAIGDKFQSYYQLFLCYYSLVKLEFIRLGGRKFLYLPKMAFPTFPAEIRYKFEFELQPDGKLNKGYDLQREYLKQFQLTMDGLFIIPEFPDISIGDQVHSPTLSQAVEALELVLLRDRFFNFREASLGLMKPNILFRTGFYKLPELVETSQISTVLDLRTTTELNKKRAIYPPQVVYHHVDIYGCGNPHITDEPSTAPENQYCWFSTNGRTAIGLSLRALLHSPTPWLVHCVAGRDRTGVVVATLQMLSGVEIEEVVKDYMASLQGVREGDIRMFLKSVESAPYCFFRSCGLSDEEILSLRLKVVGHENMCLFQAEKRDISYSFEELHPTFPCRPFLECEEAVLKHCLLSKARAHKVTDRSPQAIFVTGLPASGKTSLCRKILPRLGLDLDKCVDIDMDQVRSFHCGYQLFRHQPVEGRANHLVSFQDLVGWLMRGGHIEKMIYKKADGVVHTLLQEKLDFVLCGVIDSESTLKFMQTCVRKIGYHPHLVGVHVAEETSLERAKQRAEKTGRRTPLELIQGRTAGIRRLFGIAADYIRLHKGSVFVFDNGELSLKNDELSTKEVFSHVNDTTNVFIPDMAASYLSKEFYAGGQQKGMEEVEHLFQPIYSTKQSLPPAKVKLLEENQEVRRADSELYDENGFVALRGCLDETEVAQFGFDFEKEIDRYASDTGFEREEYLSLVNKWSQCNPRVMDIMYTLGSKLRRQVASTLGASVAWPVGAYLFRKSTTRDSKDESGGSSAPTHPHQDISYARFPGSQMFRATTWVPLVLKNADTLAFAVGSHKLGVSEVADFLYCELPVCVNTVKKEETKGHVSSPPSCDEAVGVSLGDCILFDARVWHASTPFPPVDQREGDGEVLRLAIGIQWLTPGGLDGLSPGAYHRWPDGDVPAKVNVSELREKGIFCMDTAGWFLKKALIQIKKLEDNFKGHLESTDIQSTIALAKHYSNTEDVTVSETLKLAGCEDITAVQIALERYLRFRRAGGLFFGELQGPMVFAPLLQFLIRPVYQKMN